MENVLQVRVVTMSIENVVIITGDTLFAEALKRIIEEAELTVAVVDRK